MIIDADVHISPFPEGGNSIYVDELLRRMDRSGVDKALTWLQPPYMRELDASNEYVYQSMKQHPDRILGFGWVDPHFGMEKTKDAVKKLIYDYGFYGAKLNGAQNNYHIDSRDMVMPIIEEIAKTGKLLAFHVGADAIEHTHPFRVAKIAKQFPDVQILAVHMGGIAFDDLSDAAIEFAQECPNLTLIGSGVRATRILKAIKTLDSTRVCFGSDTPFSLMHVELAMYNALLDGEVSAEEKYDIMAGNMIRLLKL
ncbi:amidohydrolase family protein [Candidatus Poribacteria bacterium]